MILLVDNYDSFTYNLYQYLGEEGQKVTVWRNDKFRLSEVDKDKFKAIVISPGPGKPREAGIIISLIKTFTGKIPILGVCLGHQAIVEALGGEIIKAGTISHGKTSYISHDGSTLFKDIDNPALVGRYHSLVVAKKNFPTTLKITSESKEDGIIMSIEHKNDLTYGIQFHPESILTPSGKQIIRNFIKAISQD